MTLDLGPNHQKARETAKALGRLLNEQVVAMVVLGKHHYFCSDEREARRFKRQQPSAGIHILRSFTYS